MKTWVCRWSLIIVLTTWGELARAATPEVVSYQGRLIEEAGPANGTRTIVFEIYALQSGGSRLYCETNSALCSDGLFSTALGASNPSGFVAALAGGEAWLQVSVGGQPLGGRQRLLAAPYAIHAGSAPLAAGSVSNIHLAAGAVTSSKLASAAVTSDALAAGAVTATALARGSVMSAALADGAVTSGALATGAVGARELACQFSAGGPTLVTNPAPYEFGSFGAAVADLGAAGFLVGAPGDDVGGADRAGAAYWYGADGAFRMTVTNPAPSMGDSFGGELAPLGNGVFAVGVMMEWAGAYQSGAVHLFGPGGTRLATVTNPAPSAEAHFGCAVAAVGTERFVAGASGQSVGGAAFSGVAHLFSLEGVRLLTVTNPTPAASEEFGYAVAGVGADRFAVGAPQDEISYAGAVYLYDASGALLVTLPNPAPSSGDFFGGSLAAVGTERLVVGARDDSPGGISGAGSAWLYRSDGTLVGAVTNPAPAAGGHFGERLWRVGSDKFAVGAPYAVVGGVTNAGVAHLYWSDGTYIMTLTNPASARDDYFGMAVCGTGGGAIVVGASGRSRGFGYGQAGAAWLYPTESLLSGVAVDRLAAGAVTAGAIADGAVTSAALAGGSVTSSALGSGAVTANALASGSVTAGALASGAVTSNALAGGSVTAGALAVRAVTAASLADGAVTASAMGGATSLTTAGHVQDNFPTANDFFGGGLAGLSDGRFAVGSLSPQGEVDVYDAGGTFILSVTNPGPAAFSRFGQALTSVGAGFAAGDATSDQGGDESGAAHLFGANGSLLVSVTNPAAAAGAHFGWSVAAASAGGFAAGAPEASPGGLTNAGAAYVFAADGALRFTLTNPAPELHGRFGAALAPAPSGALLVGAPGDVYAASGGAAHLYGADGALRLTVTNPASDAYIRGRFGSSLAAVGSDRFVVGAPCNDGGITNYAGAAYLYATNGVLLAALRSPAAAAYGHFGAAVTAVGADKFLVTEPGDPTFSSEPGAAWLYWSDGTLIGKVANPEPMEDDEFGCAVAGVGQDGFVVGTRGDDAAYENTGSAWLFEARTEIGWLRVTSGNLASGAVTSDALASGAVTSGALAYGAVTSSALGSGAVTSNAMALGAVGLASLADDARLALHAGAETAVADAGSLALEGESSFFGYSLALFGGGRLAAAETRSGTEGIVHYYGADGAPLLIVTNPASMLNHAFGHVLAAAGDGSLIVGSLPQTVPVPQPNAVFVYGVNGALRMAVTNPTPMEAYDNFGYAVAAVGPDRFAVGAPWSDPGAVTNSGIVYLYALDGSAVAAVTNPRPSVSCNFGQSVAGVGDGRLLVGAPGASFVSTSSGAVYLYTRDGVPLCCLTNPAPTGYDQFGAAVARVGADRFLVGAPGYDAGATDAGAAFLYTADGRLLATLRNPSPTANDAFGSKFAEVDADKFLVGVPHAGVSDIGVAHLYWSDGTYIGAVTNPASGTFRRFGYAVAGLGDNRFAVTALENDSLPKGRVWLYRADSTLGWLRVASGNLASGAVTADALANGAVTSEALAHGAVTADALAHDSVTASALADGAVTSVALSPGAVGARELACRFTAGGPTMVTNPVPYEFGAFGASMADLGASGFLVGASGDDVGGADRAGAIYWYGADGAFRMTVTNPAPSVGDYFGSVLAPLGNGGFAVGAMMKWAGAYQSGVVHLFDPNGARLLTVTNPVPSEEAHFGCSVSAVGPDQFVAGAYGQTVGGAAYSGVAHLLAADGTLLLTITNPTPAFSEEFGYAVAGVGADRFAVGAPQDEISYAGAVYLYDTSGTCLAVVTNPAPASGDFFGGSLAAVGADRIVVGARDDDPGGLSGAGSAWLYRSDGTLVAAVTNPTPAAGGHFGWCVKRVGADKFAVGAPYAVAGGVTNAGLAHFYWEDGTYIMTLTNPAAARDDYFGMAVCGTGAGGIVVGASGRSRGQYLGGAGVAWLYPTECLLSGVAVDRLAAGTVTAGTMADGAVTSAALAAGAVTSSALANGSVTASALSAGSVTATALASGAVTSNALANGSVTAGALAARAVTEATLADSAVTARAMDGATSLTTAGLVEDNFPTANDFFGGGLAGLSDGRFAIGSYSPQGDVDVYTASGAFVLSVTNPAPVAFSRFGQALAKVGDGFAVGDAIGGQGGAESGAAYLYGAGGALLATVTNPAAATGAHFGWAVAEAASGGFAAGAPEASPGGLTNAGAAYAFAATGALRLALTNPAPEFHGRFGAALAPAPGGALLVGAPGDIYAASGGSAHLYGADGALRLTVTNPAPDAYIRGRFGSSLAAVGTGRFVVGAPNNYGGGIGYAGAAYLYSTNGALLAALRSPEAAAYGHFGATVTAVGADKFLVTEPGDPTFSSEPGTAWLYWSDGSLIGKVANPEPSQDDEFGCAAIGVGQDGFLVGVRGKEVANSGMWQTDAGAVWRFAAQTSYDWLRVTAANLATGSVTADALATGAVTSDALASGAVTAAALAFGSVTSNAVALGAVGVAALADDARLALHAGAETAVGTNGLAVREYSLSLGVALARTGDGLLAAGDFLSSGEGAFHLFAADGAWRLTVTNPTPAGYDCFGCALAGYGADRLVVGAHRDGAGAADTGAAYIYRTDGSLLATVTNPAPDAYDHFGWAVAAIGTDRFAVGAPDDDPAAVTNCGTVYLYASNGVFQTTVANPVPRTQDRFGVAVVGVGDGRLLVGAPGASFVSASSGAAYLFTQDGTPLCCLTNPAPTGWDQFGAAVVRVGSDRFLVGAPGCDVGATNAGAAYLYWSDGRLLATLRSPSPAVGDAFGSVVAEAGEGKFIVGAPDAGAADAGIAHLYWADGAYIGPVTNPAPALAGRFGYAAASPDGRRLAVAAVGNGGASGSVWLFNTASRLGWLEVAADNLAAGAVTSDALAQNSVTSNALAQGSVTAVALAAGSVTSNALAQGGVTAVALAAGSVTSNALAQGGVTASALAAGCVTSNALAAGAVRGSAIAVGAISNAHIAAGSIAADRLVAGSGSGLDADLLDGQDSAYYRDVGNLNAGALATGRFSAYADLTDEGKLNNDENSDLLTRLQADGRFSAAGHAHDANYVRKSGDAMWGGLTVTGALSAVGSASVTGRVTAAAFAGDGSALTSLNGAALQAGSVSNTHIAAGSIAADRLVQGSGSGLDADLLDGLDSAYFRDAGNMNAGTLATGRYSAYADLSDEGKLNNDTDADLLTRLQADGRFSASGHAHDASYVRKSGDAMWGGLTVTGALSAVGSASVTGRVTAAAFAGDGSALTNLSGAALQAGSVSNAHIAAGSIAADRLVDGSGSGLDADLLDGQDSAYFRDAGNVNAGTLATGRFSAYADLGDEGRLDNDADADLLTRLQADGRFSASGHAHDASYVRKSGDAMWGGLTVTGTLSAVGSASVTGRVTAAAFAGDGSALTNLSGAALQAGSVSSAQLASGSVTSSALAAGSVTSNALAHAAVTANALGVGSVGALAIEGGSVGLAQLAVSTTILAAEEVVPPTRMASDYFGMSMAALPNGSFAVGSTQDDLGNWYGQVRVFSEEGAYLYAITNPLSVTESFGSSIAVVGSDTLAVGAPNGAGTVGVVYLFHLDGSYLLAITNPAPTASDAFGYALAGTADGKLVVGAPQDDEGGSNSGLAHVFRLDGTLVATVTNPTPASSDKFGYSVAAAGSDRFVVGAPYDNTGASDAGAAYLYRSDGTLLMTLTNPTKRASATFGAALASLKGGRFVVGAPYDWTGLIAAGLVQIYDASGSLLATVPNPSPQSNDTFGFSVAPVGLDKFVVGAPYDDDGMMQLGAAHLFWADGRFIGTVTNPLFVASQEFGRAVAGVGECRLVVGAKFASRGTTSTGAAWLSTVDTMMPGGLKAGSENLASGCVTSNALADGAVRSAAIAAGAVSNAHIAMESITADRLVDGSGSALDADLLDGQDSSYYRDAGNVNAGTLATARFSAYTDLADEGKLDNNADADLLTRLQADGRFSAAGHAHDTNYVRKSGDTMWGGLTVTGVLSAVGSASVTGRVTAAAFAGDGSALTNLSGAALQAGSVSNAHIAAGSIAADRLVDGSGSGLDADLLDGSHAAAFASSGHTHSIYLLKAGDAMWGGLTVTGALGVVGSASVTGRVTAAAFAGDGSALTNLSGAALQAGSVSNAHLAAGTVTADRLVDGSGSGLDADQLDGQDSAYYRDAGNVNAGTLATGRFSAYADLGDEGKLDNNADSDLLTRLQADGRFATYGHAHDASYVKKSGDAMSGMLSNFVGVTAFRFYNLNNTDVSDWSAALGGRLNDIASGASYSVVGGGLDNNIASSALYGVVVGGSGNNIGIGCGSAFIGGGSGNVVETNAENAVIGGGDGNRIGPNALSSLIAGGSSNSVGTNGDYVAVSGGYANNVGSGSDYATVGGGYDNDIGTNSTYSTVAGGRNNDIAHSVSCGTITGGNYHDIGDGSSYATVDGGYVNQIGTNALYSAIVGGAQNAVADNAQYAFAAGRRAKANHSGAFVWADSRNADFASTNSDSFNVRSQGGVRFTSGIVAANQSVAWMPGDGSWTFSSDRNLKGNFTPVDGEAVLDKVAALPMTEWNYTGYSQRHIGPMAQDFHAAFPLNGNGTTINSLDLDGVALAAIQGLHRRNEALKADTEALRRENAELRARLERLEQAYLK